MFTQKTPLILGLLVLMFWGASQLTGSDLQGRLNRGAKNEAQFLDLAVKDVRLVGGNFEVDLKNQGTQDLPEQIDAKIYIEAGRSATWTFNLSDYKPLYTAGGSSTLKVEAVAGVDRLTACIDKNSDIKESDEENNCGSRDLSAADDAEQKPDLFVSKMWIDAEKQLVLEVGNKGQSDVSIPDGYTFVEVDGKTKWTSSWTQLADKNFLKKGGKSVFELGAWDGGTVVKACIDATELVEEMDENNCLDWKPAQ